MSVPFYKYELRRIESLMIGTFLSLKLRLLLTGLQASQPLHPGGKFYPQDHWQQSPRAEMTGARISADDMILFDRVSESPALASRFAARDTMESNHLEQQPSA